LRNYILGFCAIVLFSFTSKAQDIERYKELRVVSGLRVNIENGDENKVVITGSDADKINLSNDEGKIRLSVSLSGLLEERNYDIRVFVKDSIQVIDINQGSQVYLNTNLVQDKIEIRVQEGSTFEGRTETKLMVLRAVSGGIINIQGLTSMLKLTVSTGGAVEGFDLNCSNADVLAISGGNAQVSVYNILNAQVKFGGNIEFRGEPAVLNEKKVLGGSIEGNN
jgi:hypothetical protein